MLKQQNYFDSWIYCFIFAVNLKQLIMAFRDLSLYCYNISKDDNQQDNDLIGMWHNLDSDYDEGSDNWRVDEDLEELGYKSQVEKEIKEKDWAGEDYDDEAKISEVLDMISDGHGDYSCDFKYIITEGDYSYAVAVAFLS